jgi:hypothetical protein
MASHGIRWILGVHVHFGTLDFVVTMEGELVWALAPTQPRLTTSLDAMNEALEELQLHTPECNQLLDFDFERLER